MQNKVKPYRQLAELTQAELADQVGVSRQTIIAIEKGKYNPSVALALKISVVLQREVKEIFLLDAKDWQEV